MKPVLKTAAVWVTLLLPLSLISACTKEPPAPPPTNVGQPTSTPTPTASPSPTVAADVAEAQEAAKKVALRYEALMDKIDMDPNSVTNDEIDSITISEENARATGQREDVLRTGERLTGPSRITRVLAGDMTLADIPNGTPPQIPMIKVIVCWDITGTNYLNKEGKSIISPGHPLTGVKELKMVNYKYPDKSQWRVVKLNSIRPGAACPEN